MQPIFLYRCRNLGLAWLILMACVAPADGQNRVRSHIPIAKPQPTAESKTSSLRRGVSILPPGSIVEGRTLGEWGAEWWKWGYSMGVSTNPLVSPDDAATYSGQKGNVFFLGGGANVGGDRTRNVTVEDDQYVFVPLVNVEWENIGVNPPWTEPELHELVSSTVALIDELHASINGVPVTNLFSHREPSPEFSFWLPPTNNIFQHFGVVDVAGVIDPVVADGYYLMIGPLPIGNHVINFGGGASLFDFHVDTTYNITVVKENSLPGRNGPPRSFQAVDQPKLLQSDRAPPLRFRGEVPSRKMEKRAEPNAFGASTPDTVASRAELEPSTHPRSDFWVTDGPIHAILPTNGIVYIGGRFNYVGPNSLTGGAFDLYSGTEDPDFPKVNGAISAVVSDGHGGWFIGGRFTSIGGVPRNNLARIRADRTVDLQWNPGPNDAVLTLVLSADTLYVGGGFTTIAEEARNRAAALEVISGSLKPWNPDVGTILKRCQVRAMALAGNKMYLAGSFNFVGGEPRENLAAVQADTGQVTPWNPIRLFTTEALNSIHAVTVAGNAVYIGGSFNSLYQASRRNAAAYNADSGEILSWNPDVNGPVYGLLPSCDSIFVVGAFTQIGGAERNNIATVDLLSGQPTEWNPNANAPAKSVVISGNMVYIGGEFTSVGGQSREHVAAIDLASAVPSTWNPKADFDVSALAVAGDTVFAGGRLSPGGVSRQNIAALDAATGRATAWGPQPNGAVHALAAVGNTVYIGGDFTRIGGQPRNYVAALDAVTGTVTTWTVPINGLVRNHGIVKTLALGDDLLYVGGSFTNIGRQRRARLAAVELSTGLLTPWNPEADDDVNALAVGPHNIVAGGRFTEIGGKRHRRIAALNRLTGHATGWDADANDVVRSMAVADNSVYVGGGFTSIGGQARNHLAAITLQSGQVSSWNPQISNTNFVGNIHLPAYVYSVAPSPGGVYAGGAFNSIGGQPRNNLGLIADSSAVVSRWNPALDFWGYALAQSENTLYMGGAFRSVDGQSQPSLAVFPPMGSPVITLQPRSQTVAVRENATLTVEASGVEPLSYQWRFNQNDLVNQTSPTLILPNLQVPQSGTYSVLISNRIGTVASRDVILTVRRPIEILIPPQSQTVAQRTTVTLSVVASGNPAPTYQWRRNGVNIPGAVYPTLTIANAQPADGGSYTVVVANFADAVSSDPPAILRVISPNLPFTNDFANRATIVGTNGLGSGNNLGATIEPGETNHADKPGGASVWLRWMAPANGIATFSTLGSSFDTLLAIYTGTALENLSPVAADEDRSGFLTSRAAFNAVGGTEYFIVVDGFAGATGDIVLNWNLDTSTDPFPRIINEPVSLVVSSGDDATFAVDVLSPTPETYQWHFGCLAIPNATNRTLTVSNVQPSKVGDYRVIVVNSSAQPAESLPASLEIGPPDKVLSQDKLEDLLADTSPEPVESPLPNSSRTLSPASLASISLVSGGFISVAMGSINAQTLNNSGATTQPGEPNHCGVLGGASKWLGLTAQASGTMIIDTIGSSIDTVLAVYRATNLLYLTTARVDCDNNGAPDGIRSLVRFPVTGGTRYLVVVDGVNRAQGTIKINWKLGRPPVVESVPISRPVLRQGQSTNLNIAITSGRPAPGIQWFLNGQAIAGATASTLLLENIQPGNAGTYTVMVSNFLGVVVRTNAVLTVNPALQLTAQGMEDNAYRLVVSGQSGESIVIEAAASIEFNSTWVPLITTRLTNMPFLFRDTNAVHHRQRFYRAHSVP